MPVLPPLDGTLSTLIDFVDFNATHNAATPWLRFHAPASHYASHLTFGDTARATHALAHALSSDPAAKGGVVAVLLQTDGAVYVPLLLGLMRAGYVPFPMSPRNSVQGVRGLLEATACRQIICQSTTAPLAKAVQSQMASGGANVHLRDLASLNGIFTNLLSATRAPSEITVYPRVATPPQGSDPAFYLHSSGSTGLPKAVAFRHQQVLQSLRRNIFGAVRHTIRFGAMALPPFHSMGLLLQIFFPLSTVQPVALFGPRYPAAPVVPNPSAVLEACQEMNCEALIAPPSFIETWSHAPSALAYLQSLRVLVYGGGPLARPVGNALTDAGVRLVCGYGGSEFGNPTTSWDELPPSELSHHTDWEWIRFAEGVDARMEDAGEGLFELVVHDTEEYKVRVWNVPGHKAYATADLFEAHPQRPGLWRIVARKDDVVTLSTGEKFVPTQEGAIGASPLVKGCVVFGRGRTQAGVLVEPRDALDPADIDKLKEQLWPVVDEANAAAPAYARIFREMVIVTDSVRPLPRSAKNTVVRKQAISLYDKDIEALYTSLEEATVAKDVSPLQDWTVESLIPWLQTQVVSLLGHAKITPSDDLFHHGFDSLSATFLHARIKRALIASGTTQTISPTIVYENPTIETLARALTYNTSHGTTTEKIETLLKRYTPVFPEGLPAKREREEGEPKPVVLLTGATGAIGSHILAALLADARVGRVITLDRLPANRLRGAFGARRLPVELLESPRLAVRTGDLEGLDFSSGELEAVTHVIHNAWPVDFNAPLAAFEGALAGANALLRVCASRSVQLFVVSSVGIAAGVKGAIPEAPLVDVDAHALSGYAASKWVLEQMAYKAADHHLPVCVVRTGQACGARATGAWGTHEWVPTLLKSALAIGCFPLLPPVAWVPLDAIGAAYVDWVCVQDVPHTVNLVHPRPVPWEVVLRAVQDELEVALPCVGRSEWVKRLEGQDVSSEMLDAVPALKMMGFFRRLAERAERGEGLEAERKFETSELESSSATMRELQPLSEEHVRAWVRFWRESGFLR